MTPDFIIGIDPLTEKLQIEPLSHVVKGIETSAKTGNGWIVRVELENK
jgi:hypothetical protein